jgi:uncharacterized protein (DUF488 family)
MRNPFYTIGHSTRPLAEFISMLQSLDIALVVDVRTIPRSRTNPQYNGDVLPQSLTPFHIGYEHIAAHLRRSQTGRQMREAGPEHFG